MNKNVDLSKYKNVFCDSLEALEWAYKHGLSYDARVKTSSPAILSRGGENIYHVEESWDIDRVRRFQSGMLEFSKDIFNALNDVSGMSRGLSLSVAQNAIRLQSFIYKAACINNRDISDNTLFIKVTGYGGIKGNNMNSVWDEILKCNSNYTCINYVLKDLHWEAMSTKTISLYSRMRLAGIETVLYRFAIIFSKFIPVFLTKGEILVVKENELVIEAATNLFLRGFSIKSVEYQGHNSTMSSFSSSMVKKALYPIVKKKVENWVCRDIVDVCSDYIVDQMLQTLIIANQQYYFWLKKLEKLKPNTKVLSGTVGSVQGNMLHDVTRLKNIPLISALHGVTHEISELIKVNSSVYDIVSSDLCLTHTKISAKAQQDSMFSFGKAIAVGLPSRMLRMKNYSLRSNYNAPIIYASTNLYSGPAGGPYVSLDTDYGKFKREEKLISLVFSKIKHRVCYKTYPEETRRYSDFDPIEDYVDSINNIELVRDKVDMRYLLSGFNIIITSGATSTLGWAVMTGKPVIFINWKDHSPLTSDAYQSLDKGLFVFNGDDNNFHKNLRLFLSKTIDDIYKEWDNKRRYRDDMIRNFFSENTSNIGKISADIIIK